MFIIIRKRRLTVLFIFAVIISVALSVINLVISDINLSSVTKNESKYIINIYIDEKMLYLFEDGNLIKQYPIASGTYEWPSPIGSWEIVEKGDWGEGFGGRWLGLNVPWGVYGIHGTMDEGSIGGAHSHGCIRMFNEDVKELYDIVPMGTPVIIKNGPYGPFGTGFRELLPGDRGADVLAVQRRLKSLGYFDGNETGIYEDDLKKAIHKFQTDYNLEVKNMITREDYHAMGFKEVE